MTKDKMFSAVVAWIALAFPRSLVLLVTSFVMLFPVAVLAESIAGSSPWEIEADRVSRFSNPDVVVAEGNVVMTRKGEDFSGSESWPEKSATK